MLIGRDATTSLVTDHEDVIGLDLGSGVIKVALVRDGVPLVTTSQPLPAGVFDRGHLKSPEVLTAALRQIWKAANLQSKKVRIAIADPTLQVRTFKMPDPGDREELRSLLQLNASSHFDGLPLGSNNFDFEEVWREGKQVEVAVVASPRSLVDSIVEVVKKSGLEPVGLESPATALARVIDPPAVGAPFLAVMVDADITHLILAENGAAVYTRSFPFGSNDFAEALVTGERSITAARDLVRRVGIGSDYDRAVAPDVVSDVQSRLLAVFDRFIKDLDDTINLVRALGRQPVDHLIVLGEEAQILGLSQALTEYLPSAGTLAPVELVEEITSSRSASRFAVALALSHRGGPNLLVVDRALSKKARSELVREIEEGSRVKKKRGSSIPKPYLIMICVCSAAFLAASFLGKPVQEKAERLDSQAGQLELEIAGGVPEGRDSGLDLALDGRRNAADALAAAAALPRARQVTLDAQGLLVAVPTGSAPAAVAALSAKGVTGQILPGDQIRINLPGGDR